MIKYFELNTKRNTTYQKFAKAVLQRKFTALNTYIRRGKKI